MIIANDAYGKSHWRSFTSSSRSPEAASLNGKLQPTDKAGRNRRMHGGGQVAPQELLEGTCNTFKQSAHPSWNVGGTCGRLISSVFLHLGLPGKSSGIISPSLQLEDKDTQDGQFSHPQLRFLTQTLYCSPAAGRSKAMQRAETHNRSRWKRLEQRENSDAFQDLLIQLPRQTTGVVLRCTIRLAAKSVSWRSTKQIPLYQMDLMSETARGPINLYEIQPTAMYYLGRPVHFAPP